MPDVNELARQYVGAMRVREAFRVRYQKARDTSFQMERDYNEAMKVAEEAEKRLRLAIQEEAGDG